MCAMLPQQLLLLLHFTSKFNFVDAAHTLDARSESLKMLLCCLVTSPVTKGSVIHNHHM